MMTVSLAAEQEALVQQLVAEGVFPSADEAVNFVVAQALGNPSSYSDAELAHVQKGIDQLDRGEFVTQGEVEAFFDDWKRNG